MNEDAKQPVISTALSVIEQGQRMVVKDDDSWLAAGQFIIDRLLPMAKEIDAAWDDDIHDADVHHKKLVAKKRKYADPIKGLKTRLSNELRDYHTANKDRIDLPLPKVKGLSFRASWRAVVEDLGILVKAIVNDCAPLSCVVPDMKFLNNQARALKGELRYPGVKAVKTESTVAKEQVKDAD